MTPSLSPNRSGSLSLLALGFLDDGPIVNDRHLRFSHCSLRVAAKGPRTLSISGGGWDPSVIALARVSPLALMQLCDERTMETKLTIEGLSRSLSLLVHRYCANCEVADRRKHNEAKKETTDC